MIELTPKDKEPQVIQLDYFTVETVHSAMENNIEGLKHAILPTGVRFNRRSQRLQLFKDVGLVCVTCGLEGSVYILETHNMDTAPHLNLYGLNEKNQLVLMTKDHIMPKSKGGLNRADNYAPMCSPCNGAKADKLPETSLQRGL